MGRGGENKKNETGGVRQRRGKGAPLPVSKAKNAAKTANGEDEQEMTGWQKRIDDVKDDLQVLKSIWFHPLKKSGTHAERLDAFYAPQARQCTFQHPSHTHSHSHCSLRRIYAHTHTHICEHGRIRCAQKMPSVFA